MVRKVLHEIAGENHATAAQCPGAPGVGGERRRPVAARDPSGDQGAEKNTEEDWHLGRYLEPNAHAAEGAGEGKPTRGFFRSAKTGEKRE